MRLGDMLSWSPTHPKGKLLSGEDWIVRDAYEERGATLVVEVSQEDSVCRGRADIADRMELKRVQGEVLARVGRPLPRGRTTGSKRTLKVTSTLVEENARLQVRVLQGPPTGGFNQTN